MIAMTQTPAQTSAQTGEQPLSFREFIARVNPRYVFYRHTEVLIDALQRVADGELKRLMIFMPPRHSKSETASRLFPAYHLHRHPAQWVGLASYGAELAYTLSRNARENYRQGGGELNRSASGVEQWETLTGGGMWAAGVGGTATGRGFSLGIIDDPLKNSEEAASATIREKQKDWWRSVFYTRQEPGAAIVLIQTRWHEADLGGWLLAQESDEDAEPEQWHIVTMPAIAETPPALPQTCTVEPDWRGENEALCPERYDVRRLTRIRRTLGEYFWSALYQQRPTPREGDFFRRQWFEIVPAAPAEAARVRWWDFAASESPQADQTAGVRMAKTNGVYYIEDVVCGRWGSAERNRIVRQTAEVDAAQCKGAVQQWLEQEPGSSGKDAAAAFVGLLDGFAAYAEPSSGPKEVRADPFAAQAAAGNVKLVAGPWVGHFLEELTSFPSGKHDDQVDAASGAFNKLAQMRERPKVTAIGGKTGESKWRR